MMPLLASQRRANFISFSAKLSLPLMASLSRNMGRPLAAAPVAMVAPAFTFSFLAPLTTGLGGSGNQIAVAGKSSPPSVICTAPSVPIITSPNSRARTQQVQRTIGCDGAVKELLALGIPVDQSNVIEYVAAVVDIVLAADAHHIFRRGPVHPIGDIELVRPKLGHQPPENSRYLRQFFSLSVRPGGTGLFQGSLATVLRCHWPRICVTWPSVPLSTICFTA
jgi:hypothetical protein